MRGLIAGIALAQLVACASIPPRVDAPPSHALTAPAGSDLRRAVEISRPAKAHAQSSGLRLLHDAAHAFDARIALAEHAAVSLDVQYYVLDDGEVGGHILHALRTAALRGVRVRLLLDDLHVGDTLDQLCILASIPNVEVRLFNPLPARGGGVASRLVRSLHEFARVNHRMHNKLMVADGVLSVSGGRNVADEYFMRAPLSNFIDMDVLAAGEVVANQASVFDEYWNSAHAYPVQQLAAWAGYTEPRPQTAKRIEVDTVPSEKDFFGHAALSREIETGSLSLTWATAQVYADDPNKMVRPDQQSRFAGSVSEHVLKAIRRAHSTVFIASPYFVPGKEGMDVLREVANRGVAITIVTNSLGATDEPLVHVRYAYYRKKLLEMGVTIYEMSPTLTRRSATLGRFGQSSGRLHSKLAVIDEQFFYVGSMNLDGRSASLNTEAGLMIDSPELASQFASLLDKDRFRSAYQVRRNEVGATEWIEVDDDDQPFSHGEEPDAHWLISLRLWLTSLFIPEEWL